MGAMVKTRESKTVGRSGRGDGGEGVSRRGGEGAGEVKKISKRDELAFRKF